MSNTQPQCACSAFFATEGNLQDHLEEYRSREQRLQAELERCRTHSRIDGDDGRDEYDNQGESKDDPYYFIKVAGNPMGTMRKSGAPKGHFCPSCKRGKPFPKMQGLRRHFQQHVACEEVCVCCFKVFRLVSEFIRHANKHDGAGERKRAYIKKTCDELREQSDKQLALAASQCQSGVVGKKRTWDMAALDSEMSRAQTEFDVTSVTALDQPHLQINDNDSVHLLRSACIESSATPIPMQPPITLSRLATMTELVNSSSSRDMSTEEVYFNHGEGQAQGLDLLQDFDAPILQIMNSVPAMTTRWTAEDGGIVDTTTEAAVYHEL